ncbi:peptide deformylase [Gordonibacter sp. Marseille-P4307]|uniref:peptide deformylase n=1 Tax=Gordonibacter sp. Marseille-P4307 TaxID=2161815 RepID=UPI000F53DA73|nr:peptide deformylase [Gordonibacter sp. Marseille-P4307]
MIKPLVKDVESLSVPCERASTADAQLAQDLLDTLASLDEAACLAANQIGEAKQVVVYLDSSDRPRVMFNPALKRGLRPSRVEEACLSHEAPTKSTRFDQILVTYDELVDGALVPRKKELRGWTAQLVQHMIDHCKGKPV